MRIRKTLAAGTLATIGTALSLVALSTTPAQASGWVANSCAVRQALWAHVGYAPHGELYRWVPCGSGTSGVIKVNAGPRPYYVNPEGPRAPWCMNAGQWYHPNSNGAVLTPTASCRN